MPLALIKGRNVIDRGEIRERERQRVIGRERERESHFSNQTAVCGTGTNRSSLHTSNDIPCRAGTFTIHSRTLNTSKTLHTFLLLVGTF